MDPALLLVMLATVLVASMTIAPLMLLVFSMPPVTVEPLIVIASLPFVLMLPEF